ncbi:hypothetical protein ACHQM5_000503 [Ranunculus cassubicifolius]
MRIRKHAKFSAPPFTPTSVISNYPNTDVCELNRSPWDVISLSTLESDYTFQGNEKEEYTCDGVGRGQVNSPKSDIVYKEEEEYDEFEEEERRPSVKKRGRKKSGEVKRQPGYIRCGKVDGKGWRCKKEAKQGEPLCEHHTIQLQAYQRKYYNYSYRKSTRAKPSKTVVVGNKKRNRNRERISSAASMDFYYYTGFGPSYSLGRKRGGRNEMTKDDKEIVYDDEVIDEASRTSSEDCNGDCVVDYFEYDDENDEEEENGSKKRNQKPIKARSLKSFL